MAPKFAVDKIARDHWATFTDVNGRTRLLDYVEMYGVPLVLGGFAAACRVQLRDLGNVVAGVSILTGLLFGLLVYVFQLRLQLSSDPRVNPSGRTIKLVEQLFSNVAYSVMIGLVTVVYLAATANIAHPFTKDGPDLINRWWSWGVIFVGTHLVLSILMCLKRTRSAFDFLLKERAGTPMPDVVPPAPTPRPSTEPETPPVIPPR